MFVDFETHPGGHIVTVNTRRVTMVRQDPADPGRTVIRFSGGTELVVLGTTTEGKARLDMSYTIRNPKKG